MKNRLKTFLKNKRGFLLFEKVIPSILFPPVSFPCPCVVVVVAVFFFKSDEKNCFMLMLLRLLYKMILQKLCVSKAGKPNQTNPKKKKNLYMMENNPVHLSVL